MIICDQCSQEMTKTSHCVPLRNLPSWDGHGGTYLVLRGNGENETFVSNGMRDHADICTRCSAKAIIKLCLEYENECLEKDELKPV